MALDNKLGGGADGLDDGPMAIGRLVEREMESRLNASMAVHGFVKGWASVLTGNSKNNHCMEPPSRSLA